MIRHCVIRELIDIVPLNSSMLIIKIILISPDHCEPVYLTYLH